MPDLLRRFLVLGLMSLCTATFGCAPPRPSDQVRSEIEGLRGQIAELQESQQELAQRVERLDELAARMTPPSRTEAGADSEKRQLVIVGDAPTKGPQSAPVKIVGWFDFQCPYCSRVGPTLQQIRYEYGDRVQIAFKHLPLPMHAKARGAHAAAEAAHRQGRFWGMHDKILSDLRGLGSRQYLSYARELGPDLEKFKQDLTSSAVKERIEGDMSQAERLGVHGTPAFFVNGRFLSGAQPFPVFERLIEEELAAVAGQ